MDRKLEAKGIKRKGSDEVGGQSVVRKVGVGKLASESKRRKVDGQSVSGVHRRGKPSKVSITDVALAKAIIPIFIAKALEEAGFFKEFEKKKEK